MERKEIDAKYKWDLSIIYADEKAFFEEYQNAEKMIKGFASHEKTMSRSAGEFLAMLDDYVKIEAVIEKLWQYASLNYSLDTSNNRFQALSAKMQSLAVLAGTVSWFVSPYILKLDKATVDGWFSECEELSKYRRTVEKIMREKPYTLSDECEQLMSKMQDCLGSHSDIRSIFSNADLRFGKIRGEDGKM